MTQIRLSDTTLSGVQINKLSFHTTDQHLLKAGFQNVPIQNQNQLNSNYSLPRMPYPVFTLNGYFSDYRGSGECHFSFETNFSKPTQVTRVSSRDAETVAY